MYRRYRRAIVFFSIFVRLIFNSCTDPTIQRKVILHFTKNHKDVNDKSEKLKTIVR